MRWVPYLLQTALAGLFLAVLLGGCASFDPSEPPPQQHIDRAQTQQRGEVTVEAVLLSDAEARDLYGVPFGDVGIRAVWLRTRNDSAQSLQLLASSVDEDYFSINEAAYLFHSSFKPDQNRRMVERFRSLAMPAHTAPGASESGYLLINRHRGGRYMEVDVLNGGETLRFEFIFSLPDGTFDYEQVDLESLYAKDEFQDLDMDGLREWVQALPCCTTDEGEQRDGDPLNVIFVSEPGLLLGVLSRSGWAFTERITGQSAWESAKSVMLGKPEWNFPVSPLYLFGRHQDAALQRPRGSIPQRNHMRVWLAPVRLKGRPVWLAQLSRDVGIRPTWHSPFLLTHAIDPDIDEDRAFLLELLLRDGAVESYGYLGGAPASSEQEPRTNLSGDAYYSDGQRLLLIVSGDAAAVTDVEFFNWHK